MKTLDDGNATHEISTLPDLFGAGRGYQTESSERVVSRLENF